MKKNLLSCLSLLLVMLVSGVAFAQPAPSAYTETVNLSAYERLTIPLGVKVEHIFICVTDTRPIDLTYDVLKVHLPADQGGWKFLEGVGTGKVLTHPGNTALGVAPNPAPIADQNDYDGRNVYKAYDPATGSYVFSFVNTSSTPFCGLAQGDSLWAVVHVLPDFSLGSSASITVCKGDVLPTLLPEHITGLTSKDLTAIADAKFPLKATPWNPALPTGAVDTSSTHGHWIKADHIVVGTDTTFYPCENVDSMTLTIVAMDSYDPSTAVNNVQLCLYSLPADLTNADTAWLYNQFGLTHLMGTGYGSWQQPIATDWSTALPSSSSTKTFTYVVPAGSCVVAGNYTFTFTAVERFDEAYRKHVETCISYGQVGLHTFVPPFGPSSIDTWLSQGTHPVTPGIYPNGDPMDPYGSLDYSKLSPGNTYYFIYSLKDSTLSNYCYQGGTDTLSIVLNKSNTLFQDGRIQVCNVATALNLTTIMGLPSTAVWSAVGSSPAITPAGAITLTSGIRGFYKYAYALPSDICGNGSKGVFYVKQTASVVVAKNVEEKFCATNFSNFNVFYLAGVATGNVVVPAGNISATVNGAPVTFTAADVSPYLTTDGKFDLIKFKADKCPVMVSGDNVDLKFEIQNSGCTSNDPITVTVSLTTNI